MVDAKSRYPSRGSKPQEAISPLKLADLVDAIDAGETDCPICGGEIIAIPVKNRNMMGKHE